MGPAAPPAKQASPTSSCRALPGPSLALTRVCQDQTAFSWLTNRFGHKQQQERLRGRREQA